MIIEPLVVSSLVKANRSLNIDEKAMQKYSKAFARAKEAEERLRCKAEYADKRLKNVANKKKSIITYAWPRFEEVYSKIQKIQTKEKKLPVEIPLRIGEFSNVIMASQDGFTDKQLVCGVVFHGITGMMIKESEQRLAAANKTNSAANVYASQVQSAMEIYDEVIARADQLADLLIKMNILFIKSIEQTGALLNKNKESYSEFDWGTLMTCVNIADAICKLVGIPVINEDGKLMDEAIELIKVGNRQLEKLQSKI